MKRIVLQIVVACSTLGALGSLFSTEAAFAAPKGRAVTIGSLGGTVRDSAGTPQIGVSVELLRADSTVVAQAFTDHKGVYSFAAVLPGQYALKAVGVSFIPALKQNLRVRANTVVNLTLNTLYDLMQWTPQPQRVRANADEDWAWTLRSASRRPLLRWMDDGEPELIWDGSEETSTAEQRNARGRRKVRVDVSAGDGRFGESGEQVSVAMQKETSARRRFALGADLSPNAAGLADAMLGFRQEMTQSGMGSSSVQTLAAVFVDPEAGSGAQQGLQVASLRSWESIQLLNDLEAEAGSDQVLAQVGSGSRIFAAMPFGRITVNRGKSAFEYRVATARAADPEAGESMPGAWLPVLSERDGQLVMEHGLHQELGWSTSAGPADLQLVIYGDSVENPMIEASGRLSAGDESGQWLLVDRASGLVRAAGPKYATTGMLASVESRLPGHNRVRLAYASGDALVLQASATPQPVAAIVQGAHARRAQMYSLALSGTIDETGTRWRASYRWQPAATVTQVAPFALDANEPYLNVYIRQPLHLTKESRPGPCGVEAQIDLRNLLAEGYRPFVTSDGSTLYFAQAQQSIRGGLAFTF